jgi:hypothetical protein
MKLQVKTGTRNPIQEEGYYPALVKLIEADEKTAGTESEMLKISLVIDYNGEEVEFTDKTYATLGPSAKLTQLGIAVGYADTYDLAVSKAEEDDGIEFSSWCGKYVRTHFESRPTKFGNGHFVTLTSYLAPTKSKSRPQFGATMDDDIPF